MAEASLLFFGNPGAGKSTLLNVHLGQPYFPSGLSMGGGLTKELRHADFQGAAYFDVPGLSDCSSRVQAAAAITQALRQAGTSKVLFVVTLENGRVRPDDGVTIRAVLLAAPSIAGYGIIVNSLPPDVMQALAEPGARDTIKEALMEIIPPNRRARAFFFQAQHPALYCKRHLQVDYAALRPDFAAFAAFVKDEVLPCVIPPGEVDPVDPANFVQVQAQYATLKVEMAQMAEELREQQAARERAEQAKKQADLRAAQAAERARQAEVAEAAAKEKGRQDRLAAAEAEEKSRRDRRAAAEAVARAQQAEMEREAHQREAAQARSRADDAEAKSRRDEARTQEAERAREAAEAKTRELLTRPKEPSEAEAVEKCKAEMLAELKAYRDKADEDKEAAKKAAETSNMWSVVKSLAGAAVTAAATYAGYPVVASAGYALSRS